MSSIAERFSRNILRPFLIEKVIEPTYVSHIGVVGAHGIGKNTLCERFGRLSDRLMGEVEPRAYREWRIDLSERSSVGNRGTVLLCLHIISFGEDVEILRKLNGIIFMFDVTEPNTLHETIVLVDGFVSDYYGRDRPPSVLVGNKMDQRTIPPTPTHVTTQEGELASLGIHANAYFDCSAKCNVSCDTILDYLLRMITGDRQRR
ncbi:hypothetical protein TNCV_4808941 [Trichonephila clavipes]|nr:hypothetical protein TNCV_4808941 [Trichonephila clavipes]